MNKLYRNPAAWLSVAIFATLTFLFFRRFPLVASIFFGGVILYFVVGRVRSSRRLRKLGYRVRVWGRDSFYYEEIAGGEVRRLVIDGELMAKGPRVIYFPSRDEWQHKMPDWARGRREEIFDRIRQELGSKHVRYIETESPVA